MLCPTVTSDQLKVVEVTHYYCFIRLSGFFDLLQYFGLNIRFLIRRLNSTALILLPQLYDLILPVGFIARYYTLLLIFVIPTFFCNGYYVKISLLRQEFQVTYSFSYTFHVDIQVCVSFVCIWGSRELATSFFI